MYGEFRDKGLEILLMSFREKPDHVRQVVRERGYVAPVLLDASGDVIGKAYGVGGPPTAYFIDRERRLIGRVAGPRDWPGPAARAFSRRFSRVASRTVTVGTRS